VTRTARNRVDVRRVVALAREVFSTFSKVAPRLESFTGSRSKWRQDEFYASVLFLSSGYMVAPRVEDLSGSDGVACRTPLLLACSSETGFGLLSVTIIIKS
jgi:hypothetical protein